MSKHYMSTLMNELVTKNVPPPQVPPVSNKKPIAPLPPLSSKSTNNVLTNNVRKGWGKLTHLIEFMFDLLPRELREVLYRVLLSVSWRCTEYNKTRRNLAWYQYLGRLGLTPSAVYFTKLFVIFTAITRLYRYSKKNCLVLVGCAYPALGTIASLSSSDTNVHCHWLTYWLLYAVIQGVDCGAKWVLPFFPLYDSSKILFLSWAQHPTTRGAYLIYRMFAPKGPMKTAFDPSIEQRKKSDSLIEQPISSVLSGNTPRPPTHLRPYPHTHPLPPPQLPSFPIKPSNSDSNPNLIEENVWSLENSKSS